MLCLQLAHLHWRARFIMHRSNALHASLALTPHSGVQARANGAQGIGLTRTEHMFFKTTARIRAVRKMIFASNTADRTAALLPIEEFQREDFEGIFKAMDGLPVTIRLLEKPLPDPVCARQELGGNAHAKQNEY